MVFSSFNYLLYSSMNCSLLYKSSYLCKSIRSSFLIKSFWILLINRSLLSSLILIWVPSLTDYLWLFKTIKFKSWIYFSKFILLSEIYLITISICCLLVSSWSLWFSILISTVSCLSFSWSIYPWTYAVNLSLSISALLQVSMILSKTTFLPYPYSKTPSMKTSLLMMSLKTICISFICSLSPIWRMTIGSTIFLSFVLILVSNAK